MDATAAAAPDTSVVTLPGAVSAAVISAALTAGARATTSSIITKWW
jgi:2-keto-3-deoxy-6-phosphogluconate aldolase